GFDEEVTEVAIETMSTVDVLAEPSESWAILNIWNCKDVETEISQKLSNMKSMSCGKNLVVEKWRQ
ncbi:hypothetical protein U1Q18_021808, partial [Sarracenia purpurea var. burkii]